MLTGLKKYLVLAAVSTPSLCLAGWPGSRPCPCQTAPFPVAGPVAIPQTVVIPQIQTRLRAETSTHTVPITRTERKLEAYVEDVPTTTYRQVTVDEGGYQQVWVPKLVTKTVPETTVQKQVKYRTVEREITEQVPQTVTRLVPERVASVAVKPLIPRPVPTVAVCPPGFAPVTPPAAPLIPAAPGIVVPSVPNPYSPAVPTPPDQPKPLPENTAQWQKVPRKITETDPAPAVELQSYEQTAVRPPRRLFSPAPSAATVWQAQRNPR
ncbi:MAG: hypothetical protein KDA80_23025 [Planctomycetaceae bacterium]|nr:hypothetical protein [Planctomycetaceae bacterium]